MIKFFKELIKSFKKDKPNITWFTDRPGLEKVIPPIKYIPEWYKQANRKRPDADFKNKPIDSKDDVNKGTIRHCPALPEFFSMGYVVPLWCDIWINSDEKTWRYKIPTERFTFSHHGNHQFKSLIPESARDFSFILKPQCPWHVKTSPGWSVLQLPVYYDFNPHFHTLPGVIRSDIHNQINQQMVIHNYGEINLARGTPLAQYIPIKREFLDEVITYTSPSHRPELFYGVEAQRLNIQTRWFGGYNWLKTRKKEEKKCPFHK
jgi:hypothetical protein